MTAGTPLPDDVATTNEAQLLTDSRSEELGRFAFEPSRTEPFRRVLYCGVSVPPCLRGFDPVFIRTDCRFMKSSEASVAFTSAAHSGLCGLDLRSPPPKPRRPLLDLLSGKANSGPFSSSHFAFC